MDNKKTIYGVVCIYRDGSSNAMEAFVNKKEAEKYADNERENSVARYVVYKFPLSNK